MRFRHVQIILKTPGSQLLSDEQSTLSTVIVLTNITVVS